MPSPTAALRCVLPLQRAQSQPATPAKLWYGIGSDFAFNEHPAVNNADANNKADKIKDDFFIGLSLK